MSRHGNSRRGGWWSIAVQAAGVAVMIAVWMLSSMEIGVVVGMAITLAFLVWFGCVRGDADENRFGQLQTKLFAAA